MKQKLLPVIITTAIIIFLLACCKFDSESKTGGVPEELLAFPGAEGYGRYTTGGRGGDVYYVTSLEDYGSSETPVAGSLRYGIERRDIEEASERKRPRTILFNIAGTILLKRELRVNLSQGNLTIAGQSAPGGGICIGGFSVVLNNTENIIMRYVRIRMGDLFDINADGADAMWGRRSKNMIIDHCTMSWSTDECSSFYGNENYTMQWCILSESLNESLHSKGAHGYGAIWGGMKASFHHNLLAHHNSRVPRLGPDPLNSTTSNELTDLRNNIFYNYNGEGCYGGEGMNVNIVNNYYIPGPAYTQNTGKRGRIVSIGKSADPDNSYYDQWGTFFIDGNVVKGHDSATADNWEYGVYNQFHSSLGIVSETDKAAMRLSGPLPFGVVTTHTPQKAFEQVLGYAGCSLRRDSIDERIIMETILGEQNLPGGFTFRGGKSNAPGIIDSALDLKPAGAGESWVPWPVLDPGVPVADSNGDGIPDGWLEEKYPGKKATDLNAAGYSYLEVYLNSLVEHITKNQNG